MRRMVPRLHLISDRTLCPLDRLPDLVRLAVPSGVDAVHLREKDLPGGQLLAAARMLQPAVADSALLLINERVDVALLAAHGVQLGEESITPGDVRVLAGERLLIGRSVHDEDGARRAGADGADFVIAGHVYATRSKAGQPGRGPAFIERIARVCDLPVIAIGGITPERVPEVLQAGAYGVAVLSGILTAPDPAAAARAYHDRFREGSVEVGGDHPQR